MNSNWSYSPDTLNLGQNRWFFVSCDLEIWQMTLKNNRAPLLCYFKLYASFSSHQWIQTRVTVWKCPIRVKIDDFLSCVTLKFDKWKAIGHLFYVTSSFEHHFIDICKFKLELQSIKCPIWVKINDFFVQCAFENCWMTLKNNRALLWHIKLCASFHHHMWIQTASYGLLTAKLSFDLLPWPLTCDFDLLHGQLALSKRCDRQTDLQTD